MDNPALIWWQTLNVWQKVEIFCLHYPRAFGELNTEDIEEMYLAHNELAKPAIIHFPITPDTMAFIEKFKDITEEQARDFISLAWLEALATIEVYQKAGVKIDLVNGDGDYRLNVYCDGWVSYFNETYAPRWIMRAMEAINDNINCSIDNFTFKPEVKKTKTIIDVRDLIVFLSQSNVQLEYPIFINNQLVNHASITDKGVILKTKKG